MDTTDNPADWLPSFLSMLQYDYLKPLGFKKTRRTFSRDKDHYWERFNFQGNRYNSLSQKRWSFFINVGAEFKGMPPRRYWVLFPHTHWAQRIHSIIPTAQTEWFYDPATNKADLAKSLVTLILQASGNIENTIGAIRDELASKSRQS